MDSQRIPITPKQSLINAVLVSRSLPVVLLPPGHVGVAIAEIKTGKQQKLDLFCMPKIYLHCYLPFVGKHDSEEVNVHEIVDEEDIFVNQFPCGDLTATTSNF
jgi:hypothetical protein